MSVSQPFYRGFKHCWGYGHVSSYDTSSYYFKKAYSRMVQINNTHQIITYTFRQTKRVAGWYQPERQEYRKL
jgi:hypothetical protein